MKKLFLYGLLFATSVNLIDGAVGRPRRIVPAAAQAPVIYHPTPGALQLGDTLNAQGQITALGVINNELINNPTNNAKITNAAIDLNQFHATYHPNAINAYQTIMANLHTIPNSQAELDATLASIKAIEITIMHLYDQRAYMLGSYRPVQSIFITGIRKNLFSSVINAQLDQLIQELYNLANIASLHSTVMSNRIWATAHSYRHWRRNMILSFIAYLGVDAGIQGLDNSTANQLRQGGLSNAPGILYNAGSNLITSAKALTYYSWNYGIKPSVKAVFLGANGFAKNEQTPTTSAPAESTTDLTPQTTESTNYRIREYLPDAWNSFIATFNKPQPMVAIKPTTPKETYQPLTTEKMLKMIKQPTWSETISKAWNNQKAKCFNEF